MPLINCPDCGKEVSTSAVACPNCGRPMGQAASAPAPAPAPAPTPVAPKQSWGCGQIGCAAVAIFALLVFIVNLVSDSPGGGGAGSQESSHDAVGAYTICQQFLKERLKAPKTADFPFESYRDVTQDLGEGRYRVRSYVDSQNSFGAMIRTKYDCTVQWVSGDQWRLENLATD
jgi:hypothetical protein